MSFDFHDVNSSHRVRAHRTWIGQPHAGQVIHCGSGAATNAAATAAARRRNGQCTGTHMSFDFHGVISSSTHSVPIARRSADPTSAQLLIVAQAPQRVLPRGGVGATSAPART
jgi:hypothetical protein